ncbi:MAG: hypothetical protein AAF715_10570 [Myxococcota bacterium]
MTFFEWPRPVPWRAVGVALAVACLAGCGPGDGDTAFQVGEHTACGSGAPAWQPVENVGQSTLTAERVASLDAYAEEALASRRCAVEATLAHRDVDPTQTTPLDDAYRVKVGDATTCLNGGFFFARYNLDGDRRYEAMKSQVDNVVTFLQHLHEDTHGVPSSLFDTVTVCPRELWGRKMELAGPTLYVNVAFTQGGGIRTFDAHDLRADLWTPGEHLTGLPNGDRLQTVWPLFDPAGTARFALRNGIARRALGLLRRLTGLGDTTEEEAPLRAELRQLVHENVAAPASETDEQGEADEPPLAARAEAFLDNADAEALRCVVRTWQDDLDDPETWSQAGEAAVATLHRESARNALNLDVKQSGTIVVGNTHFVHVDLDVFLSGGYERLERYVEVETIEQNITWEQEGFVVVYTVDDISVNVSVSAHRTVQSASLERALTRCGG